MRNMLNILVVALLVISVSGYPSHQLRDLAKGVWAPPGPNDSRGPCPALNTLANHGYLSRDGQNIKPTDLTAVLQDVYSISPAVSIALVGGAVFLDSHGNLDLSDLSIHNTIEHDASMTRDDTYFGNNHSINQTLVAGLLATSKDGATLTQDDFAEWQSVRHADSAARNPTYTFGLKQRTFSSGEPALFLTVFGSKTDGYYSAPLASARSVFGREQLPTGWQTPADTIGTFTLHDLSSAISAQWDP
eukprot:Phypoly_transcript_15349.p1 GENE.Phypoly_transcript_15349~~Phypoly_transcript_15349.p1  ORF type:complete len:246 (-),score=38.72 Phypoly_transcript_15349:84-821(-)